MIVWKDIAFSSDVARVGYDAQTQELFVAFKKGRVYAYEGVPEELAEKVAKNWSVGSIIATDIKGKFPHKRIK